MKKRLSIILAFSGLLIFTNGCDKKTEIEPANQFTAIKASYPTPSSETKTTLNGEETDATRQVLWNKDDAICIVPNASLTTATTGTTFTTSIATPNSIATFTGSATTFENVVVAYYPADKVVSYSNTNNAFTVTLPHVQKYKVGGFDNGYNPAVARVGEWTSGSSLSFQNLCSVIRLNVKGTGEVVRITIKSASKQLSGKAEVKYESAEYKLSMKADALDEVVLDCGTGVALTSEGVNFHIVLPAANYPEGDLTVSIETKTGYMVKASTRATDATASNIFPLKVSYTGTAYDDYTEGLDYTGKGVVVLLKMGSDIVIRTFAPVNCGYKPYVSESKKGFRYGKLYQWGRKYGQTYNNYDEFEPYFVYNQCDAATANISDNYYKFYSTFYEPYDWCTSPFSSLWNKGSETAPQKGDYDPCPDGWRVPTKSEFESLDKLSFTWTTGTHGNNVLKGLIVDGTSLFFPAAGMRYAGGDTASRDEIGYYWSSTPNGGEAKKSVLWLLDDKGSHRVDSGGTGRAYASSVRCVKI